MNLHYITLLILESEYHQGMIDEMDAVEVEGFGYVKREVANFIPNRGWYLPSSPEIVETYDGHKKHFEDTYYNHMADYYIDFGKEVNIITDFDNEEYCYFHKDDDGEFTLLKDLKNIDELKKKYPDLDWDNIDGVFNGLI